MKSWIAPIVLGVAALSMTACFHDDDDDGLIGTDNRAEVRVLHAVPDAPAVDVRVDDNAVIEDLAYTEGTGYVRVEPGARNIKVNAAGTATTVIDTNQTVAERTSYTVIAAGTADDADAIAIEPLVIEDDRSAPAQGNVRLRVVHAAPGVDAVDVYVTAPDILLADVSPTLEDVMFRDVADAIEVPAGSYRIRITPADQPVDQREAVYDSGTIDIAAGSILTVAAIAAREGASPVTLAVLSNDAANPAFLVADVNAAVRVVHASPDAPAVDLFINGEEVLTGVSFRDATAYLNAVSEDATVALRVSGTPVLQVQPQLERGRNYTIAAIGFASQLEALTLADGTTAPAEGRAKVRFVHASPGDTPAVDVRVDGTLLEGATNLAYRGASEYLELDAGSREIAISGTATTTPVFTAMPTLEAGKVYTVMVIGTLDALDVLVLEDPILPEAVTEKPVGEPALVPEAA